MTNVSLCGKVKVVFAKAFRWLWRLDSTEDMLWSVENGAQQAMRNSRISANQVLSFVSTGWLHGLEWLLSISRFVFFLLYMCVFFFFQFFIINFFQPYPFVIIRIDIRRLYNITFQDYSISSYLLASFERHAIQIFFAKDMQHFKKQYTDS